MTDFDGLVEDFRKVASIAGVALKEDDLYLQTMPAPHKPPSALPRGKSAVYVFAWGDQYLKVGKAGPKSQARYVSQHYLPNSSMSNLARSLLAARHALGLADLNEDTVGTWIKQNTTRHNFLLDAPLGIHVLTLLESFVL